MDKKAILTGAGKLLMAASAFALGMYLYNATKAFVPTSLGGAKA